jgi:hypothetical protein
MKTLPLALLLLMMTGCQIRYTESQLARQHGFLESERQQQWETRRDERCYSHDQVWDCTAGGCRKSNDPVARSAVYCYLLGDTRDNYTIVPEAMK